MEIQLRENWIDNIKGLGIMIVMYGHVETVNNGFCSWVTMFHIQLFLIVSGYLYAHKSTSLDELKTKIYKTGVIYLRFSIIALIANMIWNYTHGSSVIKYFVFDSYKTVTLYGIFALWYLPSYIIASLLFLYIVKKMKGYWKPGLFALLCLVMSIGASYCLALLNDKVGSTLYAIVSFPIVSIFRSLACIIFIYIGWCIRKLELFDKVKSYVVVVLGGVLLGVSCYLSTIATNRNFSSLTYGNFPVVYLIGAIIGSAGMILLGHIVKYKIPVLSYLGRNSLILLVTHMTLRLNNIAQLLCGLILPEDHAAFGFFSLIILTIFELPLIYLFNGPLNNLLKLPVRASDDKKKR